MTALVDREFSAFDLIWQSMMLSGGSLADDIGVRAATIAK
jgi:hypothetical protein